MKILVTNDDGIKSSNLKQLVDVLTKYSNEIYVVAPKEEMSATSQKITLTSGLEINQEKNFPNAIAYYVNGTPSDCVKVATSLLNILPDLVISGINNGFNVGNDILYSGTVSAAMEASLLGYKAIAISTNKDSALTTKEITKVFDYVFNSKIYFDASILNINIPNNFQNIKITNQGIFPFEIKYIKKEDNLYYPDAKCLGITYPNSLTSDVYNVYHQNVSITPLTTNRCDQKIFEKYQK